MSPDVICGVRLSFCSCNIVSLNACAQRRHTVILTWNWHHSCLCVKQSFQSDVNCALSKTWTKICTFLCRIMSIPKRNTKLSMCKCIPRYVGFSINSAFHSKQTAPTRFFWHGITHNPTVQCVSFYANCAVMKKSTYSLFSFLKNKTACQIRNI